PVELLKRLYRHCYAFTMPSKQEGFGMVYLEAMNYGKPCVGCFDDGGEDVIVHGETGHLVHDPEDPAELLSALESLIVSPERAREMGVNGFRRLHARFTPGQYQERIREQIGPLL